MTYADSIAQQLIRVLGPEFTGTVTFHVPPHGRIRMVAETTIKRTEGVIDRGHVTALRSVANS